MGSQAERPYWDVASADEADQVHALLCACDAFQATQSGTPAPSRRRAGTMALVGAAAVHVLRHAYGIAAMFTLVWEDTTPPGYPHADRPARLSRLAVRPDLLEAGSIAGLECVRKAIDLATARGADVLRAEANPDLAGTRALLGQLGFTQHGPVETDGRRRWVRLSRLLTAPPP